MTGTLLSWDSPPSQGSALVPWAAFHTDVAVLKKSSVFDSAVLFVYFNEVIKSLDSFELGRQLVSLADPRRGRVAACLGAARPVSCKTALHRRPASPWRASVLLQAPFTGCEARQRSWKALTGKAGT